MLEFFGGSTSSNIQSISRIGYKDQTIDLTGRKTELGQYLNNKLVSIMSGPEDHPWITPF
jgi:hypothetical protein